MVSTTIELSEKSRAFVEEQATAEGFPSPGAYLEALVHQARVKRAKEALEEELRKGLESPTSEMTRADWDALRQRILDRSPELRDGG
jgi:hypothetical protein